jgi:hypothetical protein
MSEEGLKFPPVPIMIAFAGILLIIVMYSPFVI